MSEVLIAFLKFGGYFILARAIGKVAIAIKNLNTDDEPELEEIVKKPRLRR